MRTTWKAVASEADLPGRLPTVFTGLPVDGDVPILPTEASKPVAVGPGGDLVRGRSEGQLVRILVVDDNPTVRHYLRAILEQQSSWRVMEARSGKEALQRVESESPNVILLDFRMPDLNGLDVARVVAGQHPDLPILMVSVYLSSQLAAEAKAAGIRGVCAKSDIGSIVEAVQALLRNETYFPAPRPQDSLAV